MGKSTLTYQVIPGLKNTEANADRVILAVSQILDVPKKVMLSKLREREAVFARNMCYYIYKHYFGMKLVAIAKKFNRDHTTVIYGLTAFEQDVDYIKSYGEKYQQVKAKLNLNSLIQLPK